MSSVYTDLTSSFVYKGLLTSNNLNALGGNDAYIKALLTSYRLPVLKYVSSTLVDVEANTGILNATRIVFPDGTARTVVEDTSITNKYRRLDITVAANFTSGTEDSGYEGAPAGASVWMSVFAVKSQINAFNFVLVGWNANPVSDYATLNSVFGTNGWVYLGTVPIDVSTHVISFKQTGNNTYLNNSTDLVGGIPFPGIQMAAATTPTATYSFVAGTVVGTGIPNYLGSLLWIGCASITLAAPCYLIISDSGAVRTYAVKAMFNNNDYVFARAEIALNDGIQVKATNSLNQNPASVKASLYGYRDTLLGVR